MLISFSLYCTLPLNVIDFTIVHEPLTDFGFQPHFGHPQPNRFTSPDAQHDASASLSLARPLAVLLMRCKMQMSTMRSRLVWAEVMWNDPGPSSKVGVSKAELRRRYLVDDVLLMLELLLVLLQELLVLLLDHQLLQGLRLSALLLRQGRRLGSTQRVMAARQLGHWRRRERKAA